MNRFVVATATVTVLVAAAAVTFALRGGGDHASSAGSVPTGEETPTSTTASTTTTELVTLKIGWKRLPAAPISGRIGEGVVWTGHEMIVWGGVSSPGITGFPSPVADGAAYSPAGNSWRTIAPAPSGVLGVVGPAAAWTGKIAVFWAGNSPDGPAAGALYHPETDKWRRLPDGPLGPRENYASVWTGKELLVIGGNRGDAHADPVAAAINPRTRSWRLLPGLNRLFGLMPSGAVWTGREVFVAGSLALCPELGSACARRRPIFLLYDPSSDKAREVDVTGVPFERHRLSSLTPVGWTGKAVVFSTQNDSSAGIVYYRPATGDWRTGAAAPCRAGGQIAWVGDGLAIPCGETRVQTYDTASDTWQILSPGRSPFNTRFASAIVWTGTDLVVWGGMVSRPGNPTPDGGGALALGR
jgi:hypothetical protein